MPQTKKMQNETKRISFFLAFDNTFGCRQDTQMLEENACILTVAEKLYKFIRLQFSLILGLCY